MYEIKEDIYEGELLQIEGNEIMVWDKKKLKDIIGMAIRDMKENEEIELEWSYYPKNILVSNVNGNFGF